MARIESLHTILYMVNSDSDLSVRQRKRQKQSLFPTPPSFDALAWGDSLRIPRWALPSWKLGWSHGLSLVRLVKIYNHACDRRTDRRTEIQWLI